MKINENFEIIIASDTEREYVFCEIYYKDFMCAEISQESNEYVVTIFNHPKKWWIFSLEEFQEVLEKSKLHLKGG